MPALIDGHYDQLATNWSLAYQQNADGFIADRAASVVPVAQQSGLYLRYDRGTWFSDDVGPRPIGGKPRRVTLGTDTASFFAQEHALEYLLDDRQRAAATPPFDPERSGVELLTQKQLIHRDSQFVTKAMVASAWTTALTGVATSGSVDATHALRWDVSGATPGTFVRQQQNAVKKLTGMKPNVLILGADAAVAVLNQQDYIDRVKYTKGGVVTDVSDLAGYFGVDDVLVADAVQNTADEGQSMTGAFIASSKDALLVYRDPNPGLEKPTAIMVFAWTGLLGTGAWTPTVVERGRDDRAHSDWFQVRLAYDIQVVAPDLGVYLTTITT